jgi:hypothetical protein
MHGAIEALERAGLISGQLLLQIERFDKKRVAKVHEDLLASVHDEQNAIHEPDTTAIDPFTFLASAFMRLLAACTRTCCRYMESGGYLQVVENMVDQTGGNWNHITSWLRRVEALRQAA